MNTPNEDSMNHLSDELLSERLDGMLDAATQARVDAHLATCADCAARYAGLQQVRATLHALRSVSDIPDFRLSASGQPRRAPARPVVVRPSFGRVAARLVSAAVLVSGVLLIFLALTTGAGALLPVLHLESAAGAANASQAPQSHPACTTAHCPTVATAMPGDSAGKTPTPLPSPQPGASTTTGTTFGRHEPENPSPLLPAPLELGLGIVLAGGGLLTLVRLRRRTQ